MNKFKYFVPVYETNDVDALIPEKWANESIAILLENMVIGNLVHRDFSNEIAEFGDIVNTRKPSEFTATRKIDSESVTIQDSVVTNVAVPLNQHWHTSFLIRDGQESKSFKDLVTLFLDPAIKSIAQMIDKVLLGQAVQFIDNNSGTLGNLSSTTGKDFILEARNIMNINKATVPGRNLIVGPNAETQILKDDTFTSAEKVGDAGTALREASLGRKLGFDIFMCQNISDYTAPDMDADDDVNDASIASGDTTLIVTSATGIAIGDIVVAATDGVPYIVQSISTNTLTVDPPIGFADSGRLPADDDVVTITNGMLINGALAISFHGDVVLDGITSGKSPIVGEIIRIGNATDVDTDDAAYTIVEVVSASGLIATIRLDRPLDAAVVDDAVVARYPSGSYNFAFNRNALAMVIRPLAAPRSGAGALSAVANFDNVSIRVVITYDGDKQGHLVTCDLLMGVKVLDTDLGAVMLG